MSKNISIQEGGIGKQLTVDKLKTDLVGGGSCLWMPEDSINLGTKHISENGTFRASDDGYLGYSEVTVSGVGTATGRDPTTGEEKRVSVNPETGDLEETIIPESIQITTLPTKVNYTNGETINYSGIVVHAYSSTGRDLGVVPFNELVFPVTQALASGDEWTDGQGLNVLRIAYTPHWAITEWIKIYPGRIDESQNYVASQLGARDGRPVTYGNGDTPGSMFVTRYNYNGNMKNYMAVLTGNGKEDLYGYYAGEIISSGQVKRTGWFLEGGTSGVIPSDGRFHPAVWSEYLTDIPVSTVNPTTVDPSTLHAIQTIPVQWPSADAGTTLETSFTINVTRSGT